MRRKEDKLFVWADNVVILTEILSILIHVKTIKLKKKFFDEMTPFLPLKNVEKFIIFPKFKCRFYYFLVFMFCDIFLFLFTDVRREARKAFLALSSNASKSPKDETDTIKFVHENDSEQDISDFRALLSQNLPVSVLSSSFFVCGNFGNS